MTLVEQLKRDEGVRFTVYKDTAGKLTIGVGRNLDDVGLSRDEVEYLLANDVAKARISVAEKLPWSTALDDARQAVLINMAFNLGIGGLLKFEKMLEFARLGRYSEAAKEMLNSNWARQVGIRATRLAIQMQSAIWQ